MNTKSKCYTTEVPKGFENWVEILRLDDDKDYMIVKTENILGKEIREIKVTCKSLIPYSRYIRTFNVHG